MLIQDYPDDWTSDDGTVDSCNAHTHIIHKTIKERVEDLETEIQKLMEPRS